MAEESSDSPRQLGVAPHRRAETAEIVRVPAASQSEEVIDLRQLWFALWRAKWLLLALAIIGGAYGLWKMHGYVPSYEAYMIVSPGPIGGMNTVPGRAGGTFRALRDIGLVIGSGTEDATTFERLKLMVSSVKLAERLQENHGYLQVVFASSWDETRNAWIPPTGTLFEWQQRLRDFFNLRTWSEPTIDDLASYVGGAVQFKKLEGSPFYKVSVSHVDQEFALNFLETVYEEADQLVRQQDRAMTSERKAYLQTQLDRATRADIRIALIELLTRQEQTAMLLESSLPYAGSIIDSPHVTARPLGPSVARFVAIPTIVSVLLGGTIVLLFFLFRRE